MTIFEIYPNDIHGNKEEIYKWCKEYLSSDDWSLTSHYNERPYPKCPYCFKTSNIDDATFFSLKWS